jgi:esterase/lipase superfamily enzyme
MFRKHLIPLLALVALSLFVVACAGDDGDGDAFDAQRHALGEAAAAVTVVTFDDFQ